MQFLAEPQIVSALSGQLGCSHFVEITDPLQRDFYAEMCRVERWSERTLLYALRTKLSWTHFRRSLAVAAGFSLRERVEGRHGFAQAKACGYKRAALSPQESSALELPMVAKAIEVVPRPGACVRLLAWWRQDVYAQWRAKT
jgi:hypothetical protein